MSMHSRIEDDHPPGDQTRCFLRAAIVFNDRMSSIDCVVRSLSSSGARLEIDGSIAVPQDFELAVPGKRKSFRATVRWRDLAAIGVDLEPIDETRTTVALSAENRALREEVTRLASALRRCRDA